MDQNQLAELLTNLRSADNEVRKAAEADYEHIAAAEPAQMMYALSQVCANSQDSGVVTLVLILLRKLFNTSQEVTEGEKVKPVSVFNFADAQVQQSVKQNVLQVLGTAAYGPQRGSAAACVSALVVAMYKSEHQWDDLWNSVFQIISADESDAELKTISCEIIATVGVNMSKFFETCRQPLASGIHRCLAAQGPKVKALKEAAFKVIISLAPIGFKDDFAPLVPDMLNSIQSCLNEQDWDGAETLLVSVVQCLSDAPQLFDSQATPMLSGLMQAAATVAVPKSVRHVAVEALLTFCEENPKTARKVPQFTASFFELLHQYMLAPEFGDDWDTTTDLEAEAAELEEVTDFLVGCSGLDRLATAIGGRKLKDTAQRLFTEGVQSPDWKYRHAAICMICHVTSGMQTVFEKQIGSLLTSILPFTQDEVKYVRSAALECIAQLSADFAPDLQVTYHKQILPPCVGAIRDPIPHVAGSAARCIDSFFDTFDDEEDGNDDPEVSRVFTPYAGQISHDCVTLLRSAASVKIREAALGALSAIISTLKSNMTPYASELVPVFQEVLAQPDTPEAMDSKCKAIECVTLLASGVGKEVMGPYAESICEFLKDLCVQGLTNDDPRFRFILRGWTCMVECLKEDAMPYVQGIMPMLLSLVDLDCDVVITEAPVGDDEDKAALEAEEAAGVESVRMVIPGVGERIAKMHTSLIEDKELASNVTTAILMELGTNLLPFFPNIARSAIKLLEFKVNDSIRESGALLLTSVMEGYEELKSPDAQGLAAEALNPLLDALAAEPDADIAGTLMECVSHCIYCAPNIITTENVELIGQKIGLTLDVMVKKRRAIAEKVAQERDEDELDDLHTEDEVLCDKIRSTTNLIGTLLERASATFTPYFSANFFPLVAQWLQPQEDDFFVSRALSIICDFVEYSPQAVAPVLPTLLSSSIAFASSRTDEALLQCDFYLINNLVQYLGTPTNNTSGVNGADFAAQAQRALAAYLATPEAASADYKSATCNAASTYVSLLQYFAQSLGASVTTQMLQTLVAVLPCDEDEVESKRVHDRVLAWITGHSPILAGNTGIDRALISRLRAAKPSNLSEAAKQQLAAM